MEDWCGISHLFVTVFFSNFAEFMTIPAIPDVTVVAVCPGKDKCSAAIYLTGIQQAVSGLGSVIMMPLLGNLSDIYGRKLLLALPLTLSIIPSVTLAWKRNTTSVYVYYVIRTLTYMVTQSGVMGIAFAYLADNVPVGKCVLAFGILAAIYMGVFMKDTTSHQYALEEPILKKVTESDNKKIDLINKFPSPKDVFCLLKHR